MVQRKRYKRKIRSVSLKFGTLNVGTITGKHRELADMMERRKIDIFCVQETRWERSKAKNIGGCYKLFYHGVDGKMQVAGVSRRYREQAEMETVKNKIFNIVQVLVVLTACLYAGQT